MRTIAVAALLFLMILPGAARGGEGDTLITDPDLLVRLGFPRDAKNVSLAKGATLDQRVTPSATEEFGTADFGWTTILGKQHAPTRLPAEYDSSGFGDIYRSSGGVQYETQISMPSGALLRQVVWVGRDDSTAENLIGVVFRVCQQTIPIVPPTATVLGSGNSGSGSNDVAFAIVFDPGHSVDNLTCAFVARTVFHQDETTALVLRKIRAGWQRQVSPAPLTATFPNDTPTTHPFFQFIEALARAEITAGCAPQSFCPDAPVTRGQMAVFLSVALGLHFPN